MNSIQPKIVILTPIKNESWILDRFLQINSRLADCILLLDQNSTDNSREIAARYPKAVLFSNPSNEYNEASRQQMLIQKARELVPGPRILLALDADEVFAANAPHTQAWQSMLNAEPGTVLYLEKPTFYTTPGHCIRYYSGFPLGYVDDGAEHKASLIHSARIPTPPYAKHLYLHDIKILHYGLIRLSAQRSKLRMYCVLENLRQTRHLRGRWEFYSATTDFSKDGDHFEPTRTEWMKGWEDAGIDMSSIIEQRYHWYDFEVLKLFHQHGTQRFWLDDVWNFDWESCRQYALSIGIEGIPAQPLRRPPLPVAMAVGTAKKGLNILYKLIR